MSSSNIDKLNKLSKSDRILLLQKLKKSKEINNIGTIIPQAAGNLEHFPLSNNQERLWFFDQLEPGNTVYNIAGVFYIEGKLDLKLYDKALDIVCKHHKILFNVFKSENGKPYQQSDSSLDLSVKRMDLRHLPGPQKTIESDKLLSKEAAMPFNLETGPLFRRLDIIFDDDKYYSLGVIHHIVFDGWSFGIFFNEVWSIYQQLVKGEKIALQPAPFQYTDYVIWQQNDFHKNRYEKLIAYWKEKLSGDIPLLMLPTDKPRPPVQSFNGNSIEIFFDLELFKSLQDFVKSENTSLYAVLVSAFFILLHHYSGQEDIIIGSSFANRNLPELLNQIGLYTNAVPIRCWIDGTKTYYDILKQLKQTVLETLEHQDLPLGYFIEELKINRVPGFAPVFQILFDFQEARQELKVEGLKIKNYFIPSKSAKFDLTVELTPTSDGLSVMLEYCTDLFELATIERLAANYRSLLETILKNKHIIIGDINLLSHEELNKLHGVWNATNADFPIESNFDALWKKVAKRRANFTAAGDKQETITYAELHKRVDNLSALLSRYNAGIESLIPIIADRSVNFLISILAVFAVGAAYVPIDPELPPNRICNIINQCKSRIIITSELYSRLCPDSAALVKILFENFTRDEIDFKPRTRHPFNLSYIIFTSGSTGEPKGVMLHERGMLNHLFAKIKDLNITEDDRIAQTASQSFDISVWQFLCSLLTGGSIYIIEKDIVMNPVALAAVCEQQHITILEIVPSLLYTLLVEIDKNSSIPDFKTLRYLVVTGEALAPELCRKWLSCFPGIPLVNAYGPTECSDDVTHYFIYNVPPLDLQNIPIGNAIANTQLYILNKYLQPVPVGIPGELYVGGKGVGRGYLSDPVKSANSFIPNPFSQIPGDRLYATGDRVRRLQDGNIEFLERIDYQIKIRGYRIEIGEIESVLKKNPDIEQCLIISRKKGSVNYLVAYWTGKTKLENEDLKNYMRKHLPQYMVPSVFIQIDHFPLTPNGKIDRKKLLEIEYLETGEEEFSPPGSPEEKIFAGIWQELLGLERVSTNDSFFQVGGDSLLTIQLVSRARQHGLLITPKDVFQCQSIKELAAITRVEAPERLIEKTTEPVELFLKQNLPQSIIDIIDLENVEDAYSLSYLQQGLIINEILQPEEGINVNQQIIFLKGAIDYNKFGSGWQALFNRHTILRTAFYGENADNLIQVVFKNVKPLIEIIDWSAIQKENQNNLLDSLLLQDRQKGFNLSHAPLMRLQVINTGHNESILIWSFHQLLLDGWAIAILSRELLLSLQQAGTLEKLPVYPFASYIRWLLSQDLAKAEDFWKKYLTASPDPVPLKLGEPGKESKQRYKTIQHSLQQDLTNRLNKISREYKLTANNIIQAAWSILYSRYLGQDDFIYGINVAGRPPELPGIEEMVGLFINTIPFRVKLNTELQFLDFANELQNNFWQIRNYEHTPLWKIMEWNSSPGNRQQPLFSVIVAFDNYPLDESTAKGTDTIAITDFKVIERTGYPFVFDITPGKEKINLKITFDTGKYSGRDIENLLNQFKIVIKQVLEHPGVIISQISIFTSAEQHQLSVAWKSQRTGIPELTINELIRQQALKTPGRIAVRYGTESITYGELVERIEKTAGIIYRDYKIQPEQVVALLAERNIEYLIVFLAVLRTGGVYLPLDYKHPVKRHLQILKDSDAHLLIVSEKLISRSQIDDMLAAINENFSIVTLRNLNERQGEAGKIGAKILPLSLAYLIFTSGSTGNPKGAMVEHRGMINHLYAKINDLKISQADTIAQTASQCFDISIWQFLAALLVGGIVDICSDTITHDPVCLLETIQQKKISIIELVPTQLRSLLDLMEAKDIDHLAKLRWMIPTGEALPPDLVNRWLTRFPLIPLLNAYGPTECSDDVTHYFINKPIENLNAPIPIGKPIPNMEMYILDNNQLPVPVGIPGELYVGGIGVGRGYINDPVKTAQTFIPNPFPDSPGSRLYKTGDLVRYLNDGNLEFLQRVDFQVKIRGFRIELGEIESVLRLYREIKDIVVDAKKDSSGMQYLCAYIVLFTPGDLPVLKDLHKRLKNQLPDYMIPSYFIHMDALPVTPNGKIDRKLLPQPYDTPAQRSSNYKAPRNQAEEYLVNVWKKVLNVNDIGIDDNFFDLGGHSIKVAQIATMLQRDYQINLPVSEFFQKPTIGQIAPLIDANKLSTYTIEKIPVVERTGNLPLSSGQQRLWFLNQLEPDLPVYNLADGIRITGMLDVNLIADIFNQIIKRHEILRTFFVEENGVPVQQIASQFKININQIDLTSAVINESDLWKTAQEEARKPFDLSSLPLFRLTSINLQNNDHLLVIVMHHIISDGWSMGNLINEVMALYSSIINSRKPILPELPIQYADYAAWQNKNKKTPQLIKQLEFWKKQLTGEWESLNLPYDFSRPKENSYSGEDISFPVDENIYKQIKRYCQDNNVTIFMFLLSVFYTLLYRYCGQKEILVGTPISNRNRYEIENLIGFFVNTLVFRGSIEENLTFKQLLLQVKETTTKAYENQDFAFEELVEALNPERDTTKSAFFQVMFNVLNVDVPDLELPGLKATTREISTATSKFDFTLTFREGNGFLEGTLQYNKQLFKPGTARRLIEHYKNLLNDALLHNEKNINRLELLSTKEKHWLIFECNATTMGERHIQCIHRWFEFQAAKTPDFIAVVSPGRHYTYKQLNSRANKLGRFLQKGGVKTGSWVGLCCDRTTDLIVGILAIIKAGGAYVPLDPLVPCERRQSIMKETGSRFILIESEYDQDFQDNGFIKFFLNNAGHWDKEEENNIPGNDNPDQAIYTIFTSGSTGVPKGVIIEHKHLCHFMLAVINNFNMQSNSNHAIVSTYAADLVHSLLFPAICTGGTLHVLPRNIALDPDNYAQYSSTNNIDYLKITPSHLQALLNASDPAQVLPHKGVIIGGEGFTIDLFKKIRQYTKCDVINEYGPTETTVAVTYNILTDLDEKDYTHKFISIGKPISGNQLYILDAFLNPVPIGVRGEIYVGGIQIAQGYLNQPVMTAEKFISDPFSGIANSRLYKTGDIGFIDQDKSITFIGRIDHQIKIRGNRVEIGEIEAILRKNDTIKDVIVSPWKKNDQTYIIAYLVPQKNQQLDVNQIRNRISQFLPDYMIPHYFIILDAIPLNANGKVDLKALPEPSSENQTTNKYESPGNEKESILCDIWKQVLGIEQVGIHDNFFLLGGDSMSLMTVIAKTKHMGLTLKVRDMFKFQTIAELAANVYAIENNTVKEHMPVFGSIPLTPVQKRYFEEEMENYNHGNLSLLLRLQDELQIDLFLKICRQVVNHHDMFKARFRFNQQDKIWTQEIIDLDIDIPFRHIHCTSLPEMENRIDEAQKSLDLAQGCLIRFDYFTFANGELPRLFITIHHLVFDVYSIQILIEDLFISYRQLIENKEYSLAAKTTSFQEWAKRLYVYANSPDIKRELDYWLELSNHQYKRLPVDFTGKKNTWESRSIITVMLDETATNKLNRELPKKWGFHIHEAFIAAVVFSIKEWIIAENVLVEMESHGREDLFDDIDLSRTIAWFTVHYPLVFNCTGNVWQARIQNIVDNMAATSRKGITFSILRHLYPEQSIREKLRKIDYADITINYQGNFDFLIKEGNLTVQPDTSIDYQKCAWDPQYNRSRKLQIIGSIINNKLQIIIEFSKNLYNNRTIELESERIKNNLNEIINLL